MVFEAEKSGRKSKDRKVLRELLCFTGNWSSGVHSSHGRVLAFVCEV